MKTDTAPRSRLTPEKAEDFRTRAKTVLATLDITKDGKAVEGEPEAGAYEVKRKLKRSSDVRTPDEITGLLGMLYPMASFKWVGMFLALCLAGALSAAMADDTVAPQSCTWTNIRGEEVAGIPGTFFKGATLQATNCVAYVSTGVTQGLAGVTVTITISDTITSTNFAATVQDSANGKFWFRCSLTNALLDQARVQVKLTDSLGSTYIYPWKVLNMKDPED